MPAPSDGFLVTHFITVRSVAESRAFYSEVLGGQAWLIMNPGGGPTPDKPDISLVNSEPGDTICPAERRALDEGRE